VTESLTRVPTGEPVSVSESVSVFVFVFEGGQRVRLAFTGAWDGDD
jgi:hypothetical protein